MIRVISLCCVLILLASCGTTTVSRKAPRYPNPETAEAKSCYVQGDGFYMAGRFDEADQTLARCISDFPYTELTDKARFLRGEISFSKKDYQTAISFYRQSYSDIPSPNIVPKARFKASLALYRLKKYSQAVSELSAINRADASSVLRLRIDSLGIMASRAAGKNPNDYIVWSLNLLDDYAEGAGFRAKGVPSDELVTEDDALADVRYWVDDQTVTRSQVEMLQPDVRKGKNSGGYVAYKYAYLLHAEGSTQEASRRLKAFLSGYPKHEYYSAARMLMNELGGVVGEVAGVAVGVLLPLTGSFKVYGQSVLHGIECAAGIYEPCIGPSGIRLVIRDSNQFMGRGGDAVRELEDEDVVAIIGSLLSKTAVDAARSAQAMGIPMISLTQRSGVAEVGDYVFRNYVSPSSEISTLVDYIHQQKKRLKRFFVLYPDNRKGSQYRDLFTSAVTNYGGRIVGSYTYAPNQMEFASELRGRGMVEHAAGLAGGGAAYDAIFIPDSFRTVGYIIPTLALMGVRKTQLLGISRWDDPGLMERGGEFVEGAIFVDSFFKNATDRWVATFVQRFRQAFGIDATLLEAMGYDAMRIILNGVQQRGAKNRSTLRGVIAGTKGFPGVAGKISFDREGNSERKLYVLTVKDGKIEQVR